MKTNSPSPAQRTAAVSANSPKKATIDECPPETDRMRVLLALDLPRAALAQVQSDWSPISATQRVAPELVPDLVAAALARLQRHTLRVAGIGVLERRPNPLLPHTRGRGASSLMAA